VCASLDGEATEDTEACLAAKCCDNSNKCLVGENAVSLKQSFRLSSENKNGNEMGRKEAQAGKTRPGLGYGENMKTI